MNQSNKELRAAMKWWRKRHPEYPDAKIRDHGWYGKAVFATSHYEFQMVASVSDILKEYRALCADVK